jgi:hypothetical protein
VAELVYPARDYGECRDAAYLVFRVRDVDEPVPQIAPPEPDARGNLYLTQLRPAAAEQGWGKLRTNASVEGRRMKMRGELYRQGLGTHAPSRLMYEIPAGYAYFEAEVGVDDGTGGAGSVVAAVSLDGARVFRSPVLTGLDAPARVRIPLDGARQLLLTAETTSDGDRFDHVNWANARFVQANRPETAADAGSVRDEIVTRIAEGSE